MQSPVVCKHTNAGNVPKEDHQGNEGDGGDGERWGRGRVDLSKLLTQTYLFGTQMHATPPDRFFCQVSH